LPERLADRLPPVLVELAVGVAAATAAVGLRLTLQPFVGSHASFTFITLGMVLAALLAGWRSGLVALAAGQVLVWITVFEPRWTFSIVDPEQAWAIVVSTTAQILILVVLAAYQRGSDRSVAEKQARLELLDHALREIDHRTRNNYATVLATIHLQAKQSEDDAVKAALHQVADRIQAIATATERLALNSGDLEAVRLDAHLCGLIEQIERGLAREGIEVECEVDEVVASADKATFISIIVNELVTNAIKHAFNCESSGSVVVTGRAGSAFELIVADDGRGIAQAPKPPRGGLGTQLVQSLVMQIGARHEVVSSDKGTTHRLVIPSLQ